MNETTAESYTKLTVNIIDKALDALNDAAQLNGDTRTDTVSRALIVYALLCRHIAAGDQIWMVDTDGLGSLLRMDVGGT
jgi:hypothetical protein